MIRRFPPRLLRALLPVALAGLLAGCATETSMMVPTRGEELVAAGRWDEAVRHYLDILGREPRNTEARLALARLMGEASAALLRDGQEQEKAGRLEEAAVAYRRSLDYNAENTAALGGLERVGRARQVAERVAKSRERLEAGDLRGAQAEAAAALRLDAAHPQAKSLLQEVGAKLRSTESRPQSEGERGATQLFATRPVSLRFRETDIKDVLEVFSKAANVNILADEALQPKRITVYFRDTPLREAFALLMTSNRLFAKKVAENAVIVIPDTPAKRQQYEELAVQTFYLTDADAKVTVNLLRTILNTRQIYVNEKLNALVIRETPDKIELARKLLEANDRSAGEVEIDLEVLEVDRSSLQNLGIDLSPRSLSVTLGIPTVPLNNFGGAIASGSTVSFTNPSLILNLVKNDGRSKTLANPTVRILDRQKARLLVGERRPFLISSLSSVPATSGTTTGTTATGAVTTTETRVEYRDLGLKLTLTPTIHLNGEVTVELNFEISSVGAPIAGVTSGQLLPPINTRNLDTFIKVRNGETRLLGGLYQEVESVTDNKIPLLSDIPWLGRLFVTGDQSRIRTDVVISITPRIIKALERPDPEMELFQSGTSDSFGPPAPALPIAPPIAPAPAAPAGRPAGPAPRP